MTAPRLDGYRIAALALAIVVHLCAALGDCALREFGRNAPSREMEALAVDCGFVFLALAFCGWLVPLVFDHPLRVTGWVPPAALASLVAWAIHPAVSHIGWYLFAALQGLAFGGSAGVVLAILRPPIFRLVWAAVTIVALFLWFLSLDRLMDPVPEPGRHRATYLPLLAFVFVVSAVAFVRAYVELGFEIPSRISYRIRGHGPGLAAFPRRGPVIVLANHSAYMDPLFLAGDLPRYITPMMTARFFDRPLIFPFVRYVFGVIRVPEVAVRREAPELRLAVEALDRGKCLVVFPEGFLQRKEDTPLRRFGRGVWEILKARPETPVVAAWIEGGWGSYFSYKGGPPTKGKRPDFRRPIDVAYPAPIRVPKDVLDHHWDTRYFLMNQVGAARALLGLPRIPELALPEREDKGNHRDPEDTEDAPRSQN